MLIFLEGFLDDAQMAQVEGLKTAESAGRYYQTHIREKYEFERVG